MISDLASAKAALILKEDQLMAALRADKARLDWLADPANPIGNVQLPRGVVERNLTLRDAIDEAMLIK